MDNLKLKKLQSIKNKMEEFKKTEVYDDSEVSSKALDRLKELSEKIEIVLEDFLLEEEEGKEPDEEIIDDLREEVKIEIHRLKKIIKGVKDTSDEVEIISTIKDIMQKAFNSYLQAYQQLNEALEVKIPELCGKAEVLAEDAEELLVHAEKLIVQARAEYPLEIAG